MNRFVLPLSCAAGHRSRSRRAEGGQPRARSSRAGLPTPGGFCLTAAAYRHQIAHAGSRPKRWRNSARPIRARQRRLSVEIRLGLYEQPIAPEIAEALLAVWRELPRSEPGAPSLGGALLGADRGPRRRQFRRPVRELPRHRQRGRIPHRGARLLGRAVDHQRAPLHGQPRPRSGRDRDGGADPAAGRRARLRRRLERDRRRQHAAQRHLGARLGDRAGRGGARPHRAQPPGLRAQRRGRPQGSPRHLRPRRRRRRRRCRPNWCASRASTPGQATDARPPAAQMRRRCSACRSRSNGRSTMPASSCCRRGRCTCSRRMVPDEIWLQHPRLNGHPAGIGWGSGRAVVVNCECELTRVAPGDVLITRVAGPGAQPHPAARRRRGGRARRLDLASGLARARARHPDGARRARRHRRHSRRLAGRGRRRRRHRAVDR